MNTKQPESLRIADDLRHSIAHYGREDAFTLNAYEAEKRLRGLHSESETLRAGYDAARLEIESLQAQLERTGFFAFSDDGGFERYDTAKEARAAAQEMIDELRTEAGTDEWPMSVESVCWGVVMERSTEVELEPGPNYEECADYVLNGNAATQPAAQALDAKRYQFLRDGEWRDTDLESFIRLQLNTLWDAKIDAAIAAKQGGVNG